MICNGKQERFIPGLIRKSIPAVSYFHQIALLLPVPQITHAETRRHLRYLLNSNRGVAPKQLFKFNKIHFISFSGKNNAFLEINLMSVMP